jgi:hypothetical protein
MTFLRIINGITRGLLGAVILNFCITHVSAQRNWLGNSTSLSQLKSYLGSVDNWRHAEKAQLMADIQAIPEKVKRHLIQNGNHYLNYSWPALPATQMLEYEQNGNRSDYEGSLGKRRGALSALVIAELVEGKGRFIPQIINGIWATCEESTWALPAHLYLQKKYTPLPNPRENIIDLGDGMTTALISWTYFLLHDQLDSVASVLPERVEYELERRVISPYLQRNDFWWMGFHGQKVNNWNPWVNGNVLLTALLTEKSINRLDSVVYKTMRSVDFFINRYPPDGGCDEGPSYWSVAGGSLIAYLNLLKGATSGKIDLTDHPLICNMGRYIYRMNIGKDYFVDFADSHPQLTPDLVSVFEFGKACDNDTLKQFAAYFAKNKGSAADYFLHTENNLQRFVNYSKVYEEISAVSPSEPLVKRSWLPYLQVLTIRSHSGSAKGLFLAAKGGTNNESHNHNDVGNFIIYVNGKPALIDIGVGTYTKETFSKNRYKIFTMQSAWHNLPTINGVMQHAGGQYKAEDVNLHRDRKGTYLSMDIAGAYPKEADVKSWKRLLSFNGESITLQEKYELTAYKQPFTLSLITPLSVKAEGDFIVLKNTDSQHGLKIRFDPKRFQVKIEHKQLKDPKLLHEWQGSLKRILLIDKTDKPKGNYKIDFLLL